MATILVVDDHPPNRELLITLLGYQDHHLLAAADGAEALQVIRAEHPDLVVADILMPTMDGYELVRQIRADPDIAATKVIFCTATYSEREARHLAQTCGVFHIITKPCEPEVVIRLVQDALGLAAPAVQPVQEEFNREHLRVLTDKLSQQAAELTTANQRLAALIEVSLRLTSESDTRQLLEIVCRAARELTGAKYAAVGVNSTGKASLEHFVTSGMDAQTAHDLSSTLPFGEVLGMIVTRRQPCRIDRVNGNAQSIGFPEHHPPVRSFLGAPMVSASQIYGWLCLTDKLGADAFTQEDERIATILAAQVGRAYENRGLYANLKRKAAELENEVAERKQAEAAVLKLNDELERRVRERTADLQATNEELEAFSYSISHDLRAPLRHIDGFVNMLAESLGAGVQPSQQHYLSAIKDSSRQMTRLIDALLAFSRTNRTELRFGPVDLGHLLEDTLVRLTPEIQNRKIVWDKAPLPEVRGDPNMLSQVLVNLLSNAVKYTRPRDPARIEIGCAGDTPSETVIYVRDNGVGFDMDYADNLFGVFQRLHLEEEFEGTGIGLANVRRIIMRHGGRTWAEAKPEQGATFYFSLPKTGRAPVRETT